MEAVLSFVAPFLVLYIGFALLALSQDRNWRLVTAAPPPTRSHKFVLRAAGYGLLALAVPFAVWRNGPGFGSLLWGTLISIAACAVTLTLSWRSRWLKPLAIRLPPSCSSRTPRRKACVPPHGADHEKPTRRALLSLKLVPVDLAVPPEHP